MILIKLSSPGWEHEFQTEMELKERLFGCLCKDCVDGYEYEFEENEPPYVQDPIDMNSSIDDMLSTACGCEFMVENEPSELEMINNVCACIGPAFGEPLCSCAMVSQNIERSEEYNIWMLPENIEKRNVESRRVLDELFKGSNNG